MGRGGGGTWIDLDQDKDKWWALVKDIINLHVPSNAGNIVSEKLLASQENFCYNNLVSWLVSSQISILDCSTLKNVASTIR